MSVEAEHLGVPGTRKEFAIFGAIIVASGLLFFFLLKDFNQTMASTVFLATVVGTLMFWRFRVAIAFAGVALLLLTRTIDLEHMILFMNVDVIIFLVGMMVVIALVRETGFFFWLQLKMIKLTGFRPRRFLAVLLLMAAIMAALVDEVTSILFVTAIVFDFCDRYQINPVKYIISVVLATNIGSSWTVMGNPIGILIALRAGLTFEDFMRWSFPIGFVCLLVLIGILLWWQRSDLRLLKSRMEADLEPSAIDEWAEVKDKGFFRGGVILFATVVASIALHHRLELALGLPPNTVLIVASITGAAIAMFWKRGEARTYLTQGVDWWTLVFFMFLFAKAGCLAYTGVTDRIADAFVGISTNPLFLTPLTALVAAFGSAAMDNVVLVAAFIPIIHRLAEAGVYTFPLWWALLFGGCYGGNITMVGSTANIVALGVLERRAGHYITLREWIIIGLVAGLVPTIIGILLLFAQMPLMP